MKHAHILAIAAVIAALLPACGQKTDQPQEKTVTLSASPASLTFDTEGNTPKSVTITCSEEPIVSCGVSWITTKLGSFSSTANNVIMSVSVTDNGTGEDRNGTISITCGAQTASVSVKQSGKAEVFSVSVESIESAFTGSSETFTVECEGEPVVSSNKTWCKVISLEQESSGKYVATVGCGINTGEERSANISVTCVGKSATIPFTQAGFYLEKAETEPVTPAEIKAKLGLGWNLGNQFDAQNNGKSSETAWGNPKVTQSTFNAVAAAGMQTVRIPVTWLGHIGEAPFYEIDEKWLDRVYEVVQMAHQAGLCAIINIHHDGSNSEYWLSIKDGGNNATKQAEIIAQLTQMWYQIATKFADCGDWLVMELCNEPQDGGWGWGDSRNDGGKQYKALNEWNAAFVKAVRAAGGCNSSRWLTMVPYSCSPDFISNLVIPEDYVTNNRQIVTAHFYAPTNYTLECQYSEWGHTATAGKKESWGDESYVRDTFNSLKTNYPDKGIPLYIGEFGNSARSDSRQQAFRKYYLEYVCKCASDCGFPMFVWDNGATNYGKECHGYFKHDTGAWINDAEDVVAVMLRGYYSTEEGYTLQSVYDSAP